MKSSSVALTLLLILSFHHVSGQQLTLRSPNAKIIVSLFAQSGGKTGAWYLSASFQNNEKQYEAIPRIDLGLSREDQDFSKDLKFVKASKEVLVNENYTTVHGKKSSCVNAANEVKVAFENPSGAKMNLIIRAYNNGMVFRYEFPEKSGSFIIKDELTSYSIPRQTMRWMEPWNPANEGLYAAMNNEKVLTQGWCYPALFNTPDKDCWFLLHESDVNRTYCGSKLSNSVDSSTYKITSPDPKDGRGLGQSQPVVTLPWKSPWRVAVIGSLSDIVESTLVDDVAPPSVIKNSSWIKPGVASWNYWSSNHGTKDYKIVTAFADLAVEMKWPYTLLDWEWDEMGNGGKLEDALKYIQTKGLKPLMWYNSGGPHTGVRSTPRDRMLTHENRVEEFTKLKKLGVVGVKIDFFESEKQDMIKYYLDILEDAAQFEMMVYFHGCIVPRGWARTYPNLMTYEAVRGAEWYNNTPVFTLPAPEHNATLPFTRNVVGSMDYTPVTFTNSQFPHITSFGHELALSVLFEPGMQHFADRPEGYLTLPDSVKKFLQDVPNTWDNTKLIEGYPGREIILARQSKNDFYIAGINGETFREKQKTLKFSFLPPGKKYQLILIADGIHDKAFNIQSMIVDSSSTVPVKLLRRGGFAGSLVVQN